MIPEVDFYLEGEGGLYEFVERRLQENGHAVIVIAEGAGQGLISESSKTQEGHDASGNKVLLDAGTWLAQKLKVIVSIIVQNIPEYPQTLHKKPL